jgi:hypothetical protein
MGRVEALEDLSVSTNIDLDHDDIMYPDVVTFLPIHVGCIAAIWSGATWQSIAICVVLYWLRMFAITAGYHRYFRIELTQQAGCFNSSLHSSRKAPLKKACYGGPRNINIIICIQIPNRMHIHPGTRASCTVMSAGFSIDGTTPPTL